MNGIEACLSRIEATLDLTPHSATNGKDRAMAPFSRPDTGRHQVLAAICLAALILPLSFTGGAVATALIGQAFAAGPAAQAWITNAFMLSFGSLLLAAGALADRYGRKRLFTRALLAFLLTSLLLACATSMLWLNLLRAAQGIAAAGALASGSAALADAFEGQEKTRAFSLLGTTFGLGLAFGPLLSGVLIEQFGWRALFVCTALLAALALRGAQRHMAADAKPVPARLDIPGVLSFSGMLALFTSALIIAPGQGWHSPLVLGALAGALALLLAFVAIELHSRQPLLDLRLLRHPRFLGVQCLPIGTCYCYIVLIVLLPLRLIGVEGLSAQHAGLLMLALSAPMLVVPLLAARLSRQIHPGTLCAVGFVLAAGGLLALAQVPIGEHRQLLLALLLIGIGSGLPWGLMDGLALSVVPAAQAGLAAGIFNTTRVANEGVALALCLALLGTLVGSQLPPGVDAQRLVMGDLSPQAGLDAMQLRLAYQQGFAALTWVLVGFTLLAAATAFCLLREPRPRRADPMLSCAAIRPAGPRSEIVEEPHDPQARVDRRG
jgi:MFS family permease